MKTNLLNFVVIIFLLSCKNNQNNYACTPCDLSCDTLSFSKPGTCPKCSMPLILKKDLEKQNEQVVNEINIHEGSGTFMIEGGKNKTDKPIKVYYHKPRNFNANSKILMVIPGAGRNGDSYRDAWVEESEKYNVLILSPMYAEENYPFEDYHLCGVMANLNLRNSITYIKNTNKVKLEEDKFEFTINTNKNAWIFNDFDRIFDFAVKTLHSNQTQYDAFGHSAGGQILHRLAILASASKVDRILASNSGFYTLPDFDKALPFGLKDTPIDKKDLRQSFKRKLVLFTGELDNENETGGTLLRSNSADLQGLHRLERAEYFYKTSKAIAEELQYDFNWKLKIIPNVGHNHRKMGDAAAIYLYEKK
ncbi:hypothetical protein [Aquimarina spongiae]|uniref:Alpha/beta hydrolase family protein n=1 Tax=Aquimarina spongiae TaxID=570521 RepID=A0A1M6HDT1_9FLAO|nr:hypothetical protein [Aquimarina spongiae]SHJ20377.1 hypothetical protein SAMN04488508_106232 [Aquimarina spongiae]